MAAKVVSVAVVSDIPQRARVVRVAKSAVTKQLFLAVLDPLARSPAYRGGSATPAPCSS